MSRAVRIKLVAAFIGLSLCATWFLLTRAQANGNSVNTLTPFIFAADSHIHGHYDQLRPIWQARIASNWLAGRLCDAVAQNGVLADEPYENVFGLYNAGWLALTFALVIWRVENPVSVIPFIFAGMCYSLTPPGDVTFYPWDMPSMFFWTLSIVLWQRRQYPWMLAVIVGGTAFKETVAVTAFLFFFTTMKRSRRWAYFGAAFVACLLLRLWITEAVMGGPRVSTMDTGGHTRWGVFIDLLTPQVNHFIWVNAGTFVVALFLPMKTLIDRGTKFVLLVFLAGMTVTVMLGGERYEFRQFLDVLPMSVLYVDRMVRNWANPEDRAAAVPQ